MKDLCGRKRTKRAAEKLYKELKNNDNVGGVRAAISDMLKLLIKYHNNPTQDQIEFQSQVNTAKDNLAAAMKKVSSGKWKDKINLSELLSIHTRGVVLKNYAPDDDCVEQGKDTHNRIPRTNPCVLTYAKVIINSLLKESGSTTDTLGDGSLNSIRFVDVCALALGKDKYEEEIKEFCKAARISVDEFYLIGTILVGFHALFYKMNNNPGERMPLLVASANARDHVINTNASPNENGIIITNLLMYCGVVPHGECWVNKAYLLNWDEDDYVPFANSLVWFYSNFYVDIGRLKDKEGGSEILLRFSGLISMTPAERKEIRDCRRANQEMMVLAAAMHRVGWNRGKLQSSEVEMYDRLFARKGKDDHANFLLRLQKRFSHCRAIMLAVALYNVGWDHRKLSVQSEKDLYQELLGSKTENGTHEELLKLLKKKSPVNSAISAIFDGEEMCDDFSDEMMAMFGHVIDSIAAFVKLEGDGSNAQDVYKDVIRILTDNVEGAYDVDGVLNWGCKTFSDRWEALKKRCIANGDETKFNLLEKKKTNTIWGKAKKKISAIGASSRESLKKKAKIASENFVLPDMFKKK